MKIAIIGASGKSGQLITKEALSRGHEVTALVRNKAKLPNQAEVAVLEKDLFDLTGADLQPFEIVVNAFNPALGKETLHIEAGRVLIAALKEAPETRLIVVGGAGSLYTDDSHEVRFLETPDFPKEFYPTASQQAKALDELQASSGINWTFISPAAFFDADGKRTGTYQSAGEVLTFNQAGNSYISYPDYAIAVVDEAESGAHKNQRFSVVGEAK